MIASFIKRKIVPDIDTDRLHPMTGSDPDGEKHWWLEDMVTGDRYDPTSDQYSPNYQIACTTGFNSSTIREITAASWQYVQGAWI